MRYYSEPDTYSVTDGYITRNGGFWGLRVDNNHPEYVVAFLGDLGSSLPYAEQKVWRRYNVARKGGISNTAWRRGFMAEFAEPEDLAFFFKSRFSRFLELWFKQRDWYLFRPLADGDRHHWITLHVPIGNSHAEFDDQIMSLTKILVDSINDDKLREVTKEAFEPDTKSIGKMDMFLEQEKYPEREKDIAFLRRLQSIRSISAAHRKGSDYEKRMSSQGVDLNQLKQAFQELLIQAINMLQGLQEHFLDEAD